MDKCKILDKVLEVIENFFFIGILLVYGQIFWFGTVVLESMNEKDIWFKFFLEEELTLSNNTIIMLLKVAFIISVIMGVSFIVARGKKRYQNIIYVVIWFVLWMLYEQKDLVSRFTNFIMIFMVAFLIRKLLELIQGLVKEKKAKN